MYGYFPASMYADTMTGGNGKHNGKGNEHDHEEDNVVRMPTLAERDRMRREQEAAERKARKSSDPHGPLINLPPLTKILAPAIVGLYAVTSLLLTPAQEMSVMMHFGFVPAYYTGGEPFGWWAIAAPVTYLLIHGSWLHVLMNTVMLVAFGAGVERWLGAKKMLIFFILCGLIAAATHLVFFPASTNPVVGASGSISGLFAAALVLLQRGRALPVGKHGILPLILVWIGISVVFGLIGGPGGETVAWTAHIGGFLGGFLVLKLMKV